MELQNGIYKENIKTLLFINGLLNKNIKHFSITDDLEEYFAIVDIILQIELENGEKKLFFIKIFNIQVNDKQSCNLDEHIRYHETNYNNIKERCENHFNVDDTCFNFAEISKIFIVNEETKRPNSDYNVETFSEDLVNIFGGHIKGFVHKDKGFTIFLLENHECCVKIKDIRSKYQISEDILDNLKHKNLAKDELVDIIIKNSFNNKIIYSNKSCDKNQEYKLLLDSFNFFNLSIVSKSFIHHFWNTIQRFMNQFCEDGRCNMNLEENKTKYYLLWKQRRLPLILDYNLKNRSIINNILSNFENKLKHRSIILICDESLISIPVFEQYKIFNNISDMNDDLLKKNLNAINISFQGKVLANLFSLIGNKVDILKQINPNVYLYLMKECVERNENIDLPFYFPRKLRKVLFSKELLLDDNNIFILLNNDSASNKDLLKFMSKYESFDSEIEKYQFLKKSNNVFSYSKSIEELRFIATKLNNLTSWPVHILKYFNEYFVEWIYSRGKIEDLRKHSVESDVYFVSQEEYFQNFCNSCNIISGDSGIGKSYLLKYFYKSSLNKYWNFQIDLTNLNICSFKDHEDMLKYFFKNQLLNGEEFMYPFLEKLFFNCIRKGQIMFFIDEYDENNFDVVKDFVKIIIDLGIKMFITVGTNKKHLLENELGIFSYNLLSLTKEEQTEYLKTYLKSKEIDSKLIFILKNKNLNPPMLTLLASLLENDLLNELENNIEHLDIYLCEKYLRNKIQPEMYDTFSKCALRLFFSDTCLKENFNIDPIEISQDIDLTFLHNCLKEFLCAEYLTNQIVSNREKYKCIYDKIFYVEMSSIKFYFDKILSKKLKLHTAVLNNDIKLVKTLLNEKNNLNEIDSIGRTALNLAASYGKFYDIFCNDTSEINSVEKHVFIKEKTSTFIKNKIFTINFPVEDKKSMEINKKIVILLLENQYEDIKNIFNKDSVDVALQSGSLEILEILCKQFKNKIKIENYYVYYLLLYYCARHNFPNLFASILNNDMELKCIFNKHDLATIAVENNNREILSKLLESTVFNIEELELFHLTCRLNYFDILSELARFKSNINQTNDCEESPLTVAIKYSSMNIINLLINEKADLLIRDRFKKNLLHHAISAKRDIKVIETLINHEVRVNDADVIGTTPLMLAAKEADGNVFDLIISHKANCLNKNYLGQNILHYACQNESDNVEIVEKIIFSIEIPIDSQDDCLVTPLIMACQFGNVAICKTLIQNNADVNLKDNNGRNALFFACIKYEEKEEFNEIIELLLKKCEYVCEADFKGNTILDIVEAWTNDKYKLKISQMLNFITMC